MKYKNQYLDKAKRNVKNAYEKHYVLLKYKLDLQLAEKNRSCIRVHPVP